MSWTDLLKQNFNSYIQNDNFVYNNITTPLLENNRERIMCMLTTGQMIPLSNDRSGNYRLEHYVEDVVNATTKPIDLALIIPFNNEDKILGFHENKILDGTLETTVRKAVDQIYDHYIIPAIKNNKIINVTTENNLFITISVYSPEIFLHRPDNLQNYLNSTEVDVKTRLNKFGFVTLTTIINTNTIANKQDLITLFNDRILNAKSTKKDPFVFIPPLYKNILGRIFNGESKHELYIRTKISELEKLPFFNPNPISNIANVRNFTEERKDKLEAEILTSLISLHKQTMPGTNCISEDEAHRSLGAKPRILSYNENQTIVLIEGEEPHIKCNLKYITTDMSIIDGQHSSIAFIDILAKSKKPAPELSTQKIINKIYNAENMNWSDFSRYFSAQYIDIYVTGYKNSKNAQTAARNQNNTRSQTNLEQKINTNRNTIVKLAEYWNAKESNFKLIFNKSAYDYLPNPKWQLVDPSVLVPVYALWGKKDINKDNASFNTFLSKSGSQGNATIGKYFEAALSWYFLDNKNKSKFNDMLAELATEIDKLDLNNDIVAVNDLKNRVDNILKDLKKIVMPMDVKKHLSALELNIEEEEYEHATKRIEKIQELIVKLTEIDPSKLEGAVLITEKAIDAIINKNIPFLSQVDTKYYFLMYYHLQVKEFYKEKNVTELSKVNTTDLDLILKDVLDRLASAENEPLLKNKSMQTLDFASNAKPMDSILYKLLFE